MAYNDAQLFYAQLYWISALPGAEAFMADACRERGVEVVEYKAPRTNDEQRNPIPPLTKGQFDTIMSTLNYELTKPDAIKNYTSDGTGVSYLELRRSMVRVFPPRPPTIPTEIALAAAGINDENVAKISTAFLHDTGQLFVYTYKDGQLVVDEMMYPGRPEMPFKSHPHFKAEDMTQDGKFVFEHYFRVERLAKDEKYTWTYNTVAGKPNSMEMTNYGDSVVTVSGSDPMSLVALSREDILAGKVVNSNDEEKRYTGNYVDAANKERVDATEFPGVYRELRGPFNYMAVKERMQLYSGSSFVMAEPGDRLWVEKEGYKPRVISAANHHLMKPYRKPAGGAVKFKPKP